MIANHQSGQQFTQSVSVRQRFAVDLAGIEGDLARIRAAMKEGKDINQIVIDLKDAERRLADVHLVLAGIINKALKSALDEPLDQVS